MAASVTEFPSNTTQEICKICNSPAIDKCLGCGLPKCAEHTSNVDFAYCSGCNENVTIAVQKVSKNSEEYDEWKDEVTITRHECKNVHFTGQHWIQGSLAIEKMPDDILKSSLEYHKGKVSALEYELTHRRIKRARLDLGYPTKPKSGKVIDRIEREKKVSVTRKADPMDKLVAAMSNSNIDPMKLMEMLKAKLGQKK